MKHFVFFLLWFVFLGIGYLVEEWTGLLVGWTLFAIIYSAVTEGLKSAYVTFMNICLGITLLTGLLVLGLSFKTIFPKIPTFFYAIAFIGTYYIIFDKLSLKEPKKEEPVDLDQIT